jgi:hypothetical protein
LGIFSTPQQIRIRRAIRSVTRSGARQGILSGHIIRKESR